MTRVGAIVFRPSRRHAFSLASLFSLLAAMACADAATFALAPERPDIVGELQWVEARAADTLLDIARRHDLGYEEIRLANPNIDPWLPGEGTRVLLPTQYILPDAPRKGIVINLAEFRLYYYPPVRAGERSRVMTFPVGIGRYDWETPLGATQVVAKAEKPTWYPPASIREDYARTRGIELPTRVPPGPDNPLGDYALRLGIPGYLIHGTNRPYGVGARVSYGCIRLYPEDIETLFAQVSTGVPVHIVNQPVKAAWVGDTLYFEVHLPAPEVQPMPVDWTAVTRGLVNATRDRPDHPVDWGRSVAAAAGAQGIPVPVPLQADAGPSEPQPSPPAQVRSSEGLPHRGERPHSG